MFCQDFLRSQKHLLTENMLVCFSCFLNFSSIYFKFFVRYLTIHAEFFNFSQQLLVQNYQKYLSSVMDFFVV